ncbi:type II toxin-antitoxin system HicB family antitoxin [Corynebacterium callunae]|uniref:type II toxin-antitoxin system HicB family antitoxin n=1 Tax=Corynebacterium callunae TaxID=1721 RepID=UPI003982D24F
MDSNKFTYQVLWSGEDQEFLATVLEFPSLSWLAKTRQDTENGLVELVVEVLEDMALNEESIPQPLGERTFSGKFNVRTSSSLHRKLVLAAASEGISLNALINQKLSAS